MVRDFYVSPESTKKVREIPLNEYLEKQGVEITYRGDKMTLSSLDGERTKSAIINDVNHASYPNTYKSFGSDGRMMDIFQLELYFNGTEFKEAIHKIANDFNVSIFNKEGEELRYDDYLNHLGVKEDERQKRSEEEAQKIEERRAFEKIRAESNMGEKKHKGQAPKVWERKIVKTEDNIYFDELKEYMAAKGLERQMGNPLLKQLTIKITDTGDPSKSFTSKALGFQNIVGGYETRTKNPKYGKEVIGDNDEKTISFIKGKNNALLSVFESWTSYLAALEISNQKKPQGDVVILNGTSQTKLLIASIQSAHGVATQDWTVDAFEHKVARVLEVAKELGANLKNYKNTNLFYDNDNLHKIDGKIGTGEYNTALFKEHLGSYPSIITDASIYYKNSGDIGDHLLELKAKKLILSADEKNAKIPKRKFAMKMK